MAKIEVLHRRTLSIETSTPDAPRGPAEGGAARYTSSPDTPISAPVTTTTLSPESSNTAQPAARAKKTTCQRCKRQLESGNKLHKHLRESCRYTRQQRETRPNTTASSKASPYQKTSLSLDEIRFDLQENPWANDYGSNDAPASN